MGLLDEGDGEAVAPATAASTMSDTSSSIPATASTTPDEAPGEEHGTTTGKPGASAQKKRKISVGVPRGSGANINIAGRARIDRTLWPNIPKILMNKVGKAIMEYDMIRDGDRVLIGLSGGKDSLCLLHILHAFQQRAPIKFDLACTWTTSFGWRTLLNVHLDMLYLAVLCVLLTKSLTHIVLIGVLHSNVQSCRLVSSALTV